MNASAPPLAVACAADAAYALPLAVMLRSVDAQLAADRQLVAWIVDDGLSPEDRTNAAAALSPRCTLHWVRARPWEKTSLTTWGRMPLTTYQKLSVGDWLPADLDRVLWLDCDLIALADLAPLWALPTGDRVALAATDSLVPRIGSRFGVGAWQELGLEGDAGYFNAGVMLIDLAKWRRDDIAGQAAAYLRRFGDRVVFWDQEALNAVLAGKWGALDPRWNRNPILHRLFGDRAPRGCAAGADEAWIAHFSGRLKPWNCPDSSPYQKVFEAHLADTPWRGWRPPRTLRGSLLARYADSTLRRHLFPLEQWWTLCVHALTRRRVG